jgi:hypothetical protein
MGIEGEGRVEAVIENKAECLFCKKMRIGERIVSSRKMGNRANMVLSDANFCPQCGRKL